MVLTSETQKTLINVVIISPFIMALYGFLVMLFSCPCTKFNFRWSIFKLLRDFIESSGDLVGTLVCIIVSLLCVAYVSLFDAESETTIYSRLEMLVNYALQVQVTSAVIDTLRCLLVFTPFYVDVKICCFVPILRLGDWVGQMRMSKSARYGTKPPSHTVCCVKSCILNVGAWTFDKYRKNTARIVPFDESDTSHSRHPPYMVQRYERHLRQDVLSRVLQMVRYTESESKQEALRISVTGRPSFGPHYGPVNQRKRALHNDYVRSSKRVVPLFRFDPQEDYELMMTDFFASMKSERMAGEVDASAGAGSPRRSPERTSSLVSPLPSPSRRSPIIFDIEASSPAPHHSYQ